MARVNLYVVLLNLFFVLPYISADYVAAIVEYQSMDLPVPSERISSNLEQYIFNIDQARKSGVQIIVFPEYGITGVVSNVSDYAINVPNVGAGPEFTDDSLQRLSSAAIGHAMYIVVNLLEKANNTKNNTVYYNTNLVFDKQGKIAAKYRKINLFEEPSLTPGVPADNHAVFTTDFGVTFGLFTCYDITFENPSRTILRNTNVTDIVYPTAWVSYLPFFHSSTVQAGYAVANGVNLLAANLNDPAQGAAGSGIYGADGTVYSYYMSGNLGTKLKTATVKNTPVKGRFQSGLRGIDSLDDGDVDQEDLLLNLKARRYFNSDRYAAKKLNISQTNIDEEICQKSFCCHFKINVTSKANSSDIYKIIAYNGPFEFQNRKENQKLCSIIACKSDDIDSCGERGIKPSSVFNQISVTTSVPKVDYFQPISLTTKLITAFNTTYSSIDTNTSRTITFAKELEQDRLLVFGIIGTPSSSGDIFVFNSLLIICGIFIQYVLF